MSNQDPTKNRLTPAESRAMDVLLEEVYQRAVPPDLTDDILAQLGSFPDPVDVPDPVELHEAIVRETPLEKPTESSFSRRARVSLAWSLIAAVAASLIVAMSIWPNRNQVDDGPSIAALDATEDRGGPQIDPERRSVAESEQTKTPSSPARPLRGIPLVLRDDRPSAPDVNDVVKFTLQTPSANVASTLVSANIAADMEKYWQSIGIEPSAEASPAETAKRLEAAIGAELSEQAIADAELIQQELQRPRVARTVAVRWLLQVTQGGLMRLDEPSRNRLVAKVADSFRSKTSLDRLLANWAGGDDEETSAFYDAFSVGGEHQRVRRLGELTMNVDLRCVQCHDAYIAGTGTQHDYWSFAAFFRNGLQRQGDRWVRRSGDNPTKPTYYALSDDRQKLAEPAVPGRWLSQQEPIVTLGQWSTALVGSEQLARGIVNSLWRLVYDRPLRGRVVDTMTAPHDDSLDRLEQRLTDDLVASQFDIGRTLALIISAPAARRSVPEALLPENALAASNDDLWAAAERVNAFAAVAPPRNRLSLDRRIDLAMRRVGLKIEDVNNTVLAQGAGNAPPANTNPSLSIRPEKGGDFPGKASSLPVQWLSNIDTERGQIEHLAYLSGMSEAPQRLLETAEAIREADDDWQLTLQRVWWLVRPQ